MSNSPTIPPSQIIFASWTDEDLATHIDRQTEWERKHSSYGRLMRSELNRRMHEACVWVENNAPKIKAA